MTRTSSSTRRRRSRDECTFEPSIQGAGETFSFESDALNVPRNDLVWDGDSKRIIAVGDGREK